jgi:hypothetical protein
MTPATASSLPSYLAAADDTPHPLGAETAWSENYLTHAYDPAAGVGFFLHAGLSSFDDRLWNDFFVAFLPGDRFLVANGFAAGETARGTEGGQLKLRCDEPFVRWTKSFHGAASLVSGAELRAGPFAERGHVRVDAHLTFEALGPAFDLGALDNETWSTSHYEQHMSFRGSLEFEGARIPLSGTGLRDHSWGPRDMSRIDNHAWAHGQLPDGQTFMAFFLADVDGKAGGHAAVGEPNRMEPAEILTPLPLLTDPAEAMTKYEFTLGTSRGELTVHGEPLQIATCALAGPSELLFGAHQYPAAHHILLEAQTKFTVDGQTCYGLTDRTVRLHG